MTLSDRSPRKMTISLNGFGSSFLERLGAFWLDKLLPYIFVSFHRSSFDAHDNQRLVINMGIHGFSSRVRVGRGSDGVGHWGIWAGEVTSKRSKTLKK